MIRPIAILLVCLLAAACTVDAPSAWDMGEDRTIKGFDQGPSPTEDMSSVEQDMDRAPDLGPGPDQSQPPDCGSLDTCGLECVDTQTSPNNCGLCGRTCVLRNAVAGCAGGDCTIARCEPGFFDVDGDLGNGCEADSSAVCQGEGEDCQTACGSTGVKVCQGTETMCEIPQESCNATDDDCDGQCDGGLQGCRRGIHRGRDGGHIYTNNKAIIPTVESENYFYLYINQPQGHDNATFRPVFLCRKGNGKHFLTSSTNCEMAGSRVAELGFWAPEPTCDSRPLYRVYNAAQQNHFYTVSAPERDNAVNNLGYANEGIAGHVWRGP